MVPDKALFREKIQGRIGRKRWEHSLRVAQEAERLALLYGVDPEKAILAGLLHDNMKVGTGEKLFRYCRELGYTPSEDERRSPQIIHGPLGALGAKRDFRIEEEDVLHAIAVHTTGSESMSVLDKIIFIADVIEPQRDFPGVEKLRELADTDLDQAVLYSLNSTIAHLLENDQVLAVASVKARNSLLGGKDEGIF